MTSRPPQRDVSRPPRPDAPSTANGFEDLPAWQRARHMTRVVYDATDSGTFRTDTDLRQHVRRASLAIMSEVAIGHERANPRDYHAAIDQALAACADLRSSLYLAHDIHYIDDRSFASLSSLAQELQGVLTGLRTALARRIESGRDADRPPRRDAQAPR